VSAAPHAAKPWVPVKGVAIELTYQYKLDRNGGDAAAMRIGTQLFSYVRNTLHANAVSLNFPFYQAGSRSNDPQRWAFTPSPGRLAMLTLLAHRFGLSVQYRPFLDEANLTLHGHSRPSIEPTNVTAWFQHYWTFLEPYLESANEAGAQSFSVALEFTSLLGHVQVKGVLPCDECLSQWAQLVAKARTVFPGQLIYSQQHDPEITIPLTARGYDAYQPIVLKPSQVSVASFTTGFLQNFQMSAKSTACPICTPMQAAPSDLIVEELGIPAVAGAYLKPDVFFYPPRTAVDRRIQRDWFQGACNAFWTLHLGGLYYWSIDFNTFTPTQDNRTDPYAWVNTSSASAIRSCFARTS
jgi:hypothetical protein